ncbi:phosphatase PAP2 family protein [Kineococcus sp. NBC_00420]|uniref:phosphatase PAP2 family protein n=1 Tax=Kineococcus sp. NBC_00420 TaxID=2903564 RepID=UPI002E249AFF
MALYSAYTLTRLLASDNLGIATENAHRVLALERFLRIDGESSINRMVAGTGWAATLSSYWYASLHYVVTLGVLVVLHRRAPAHYRRLRTILVVATLLALVGYILLPTAPPRLLGGYLDVLAATSEHGWWGADASAPRGLGAATNELAAMPSMHVGWSVWVAIALRTLLHRPRLRTLVWAYPATTTFVVVATGNHWVLDAVAGAALVVLVSGVLGARVRRTQYARSPRTDDERTPSPEHSGPHTATFAAVPGGAPRNPSTSTSPRNRTEEEPCTSVST